MRISYVNDNYIPHDEAFIHIEDRGNVFSDGVYEVIYVKNGQFIDWNEHLERLERSLAGLRINYEVSSTNLLEVVVNLLEKNGLSDSVVYLQISRGVAKRDHAFPSPEVTPSIFITVSPANLPDKKYYENGVSLITTADLRWKRRDFKTISLLPNCLAKQEAAEKGAMEALLFEEDGSITEGSSTNFFAINKNGQLQTHAANNYILNGITRMGVLKVAKEAGIEVIETPISINEIGGITEAFITSTTKHIMPVVQIDDKKIGDGKVGSGVKQLINLYQQHIEKQCK